MALRQHNLQTIAERRPFQRRKVERHRFARSGLFGAVKFSVGLERGGIRVHLENVVAIAEPVIGGFLHRGRGRGLHPLQIVLVTIGIAPEALAAREQVTLTAEAANPFHDPRIPSENLRLGQLQLGRAGAVLKEVLQFFVCSLFHLAQISARIRGEREVELPADLVGVIRGSRAGRNLIFVDQALVEPRSLTLAEHARRQVQQRFFGGAKFRHIPDAIQARLRHAVLHPAAMRARAFRDPHFLLGDGRPRRNLAIILFDFFARDFRRHVARNHHRDVVRTVISLKPFLDVAQRSSVEVFHGTDHRP